MYGLLPKNQDILYTIIYADTTLRDVVSVYIRKNRIIYSSGSLCTNVILAMCNLFLSLPDDFITAYCHLLGSVQNCHVNHQIKTKFL